MILSNIKSLQIFQTLFGIKIVQIKGDGIERTGYIYKVYSMLLLTLMIVSGCGYVLRVISTLRENSFLIQGITILVFCLVSLYCIVSTLVLNNFVHYDDFYEMTNMFNAIDVMIPCKKIQLHSKITIYLLHSLCFVNTMVNSLIPCVIKCKNNGDFMDAISQAIFEICSSLTIYYSLYYFGMIINVVLYYIHTANIHLCRVFNVSKHLVFDREPLMGLLHKIWISTSKTKNSLTELQISSVTVREICLVQIKLMDILEIVNSMYNNTILFASFSLLVNVILGIPQIVDLDYLKIGLMVVNNIYIFINTLGIITLFEALHYEHSNTNAIIGRMIVRENKDENTRRALRMLVSTVTTRKPNVFVHGMYQLDYYFLFDLIGVMVNYAIIILQFKN